MIPKNNGMFSSNSFFTALRANCDDVNQSGKGEDYLTTEYGILEQIVKYKCKRGVVENRCLVLQKILEHFEENVLGTVFAVSKIVALNFSEIFQSSCFVEHL